MAMPLVKLFLLLPLGPGIQRFTASEFGGSFYSPWLVASGRPVLQESFESLLNPHVNAMFFLLAQNGLTIWWIMLFFTLLW